MTLRRSIHHVRCPGSAATLAVLLGGSCLAARPAFAQTGYIAPDGRNRFPAVTIFCPSGTGVAPCNFGGGGQGGGSVSLNLAGAPVSATNRLPVSDQALAALITGGALTVGGTVGVSALPALPAGTNALGSVTISNLPTTQPVSGSVTVSALPALPAGGNTIGAVTISGTPTFNCNGCGGSGGGAVTQGTGSASNPWWLEGLGSAGTPAGGVLTVQGTSGGMPVPVSGQFWQSVQPVSGTVAVSGLPALPAGTNAIGSVSVSNLPATQAVSAAALPLPAGAATSALQPALNADGGALVHITNPISSVSVTALPALPAGSNAIGQVSVSNLPATQAISAASLPLPAGAATAASQTAPLTPVAPATATATNAVLLGCQASTTLPTFTAGQQGAVPCDTNGRPYVVTVPSANNVPSFLQAVTAGGASVFRAINTAASAMAASIKSGSGMIYGYEACNSGASAAYLRFFALATAPTVGTSTPAVTKLLPAGACQTMATSLGLVFSGGIAMDATSGSLADSDTSTIATANQVVVAVYYK